MANPNNRWEDNVPGQWYVDKECIDCNLCIERAPASFAESEDATHDYVYKQPETEEEVQAAMNAMEDCPVEAIGNDG